MLLIPAEIHDLKLAFFPCWRHRSLTYFKSLHADQPYWQDDTIKQAYRQASKKYHPDRNLAGLEMMKAINSAFDILKSYTLSEYLRS